jgi:hypothetical protein
MFELTRVRKRFLSLSSYFCAIKGINTLIKVSSHSLKFRKTLFSISDPNDKFGSKMGGTSKFLLLFLHFIHTLSLFHFPSLFLTFLRFFSSGTQVEREEKVSLELSEEILQSMEVGMSFKDYVSNFYHSVFYFVFFLIV